MMTLRPATAADIPGMLQIFEEAKQKMRAAGNLTQWEEGYPSAEILNADIRQHFSYVIEQDRHLVATFVLALCKDPTYRHIYGGHWLDDTQPYGTIHRLATRHGIHGVTDFVLRWAFRQIPNIRIDTHRDNLPMRHLLEKHHFTYCGVIHVRDGSERLAYQRLEEKIKNQ